MTPGSLISEICIWRVGRSEKYPDGVKYRLALVDPDAKKVLLLFDNHWPKGHHVHVGSTESRFAFTTVETLIYIFDERSTMKEKEYREGKKEQNQESR